MKQPTKTILITSVCLLSLGLVLMTIGFLCGADIYGGLSRGAWNTVFNPFNSNNAENGEYDNEFADSNTYTVAASDIESLSVDWISGKVDVIAYDGKDIVLEESANRKITEKSALGYQVRSRTLYIDDFKANSSVSFGSKDYPSKDLTIKLPKEFAADLADFSFEGVSADLEAAELTCKNFNADTVSGDLTVHFINCPASADIDTVSGEISLYLPESCSPNLYFDTTSGKLESEFAMKNDGRNQYIVGRGTGGDGDFEIETTSGDVTLYVEE